MKKTKIICTIGPSTKDEIVMKNLVKNGMDIARFNFSHGNHEEHRVMMDRLKKVRSEVGKPIAILLDTKGPEIRTGTLENGKKIELKKGQTFCLSMKETEGNTKRVSVSYNGLLHDVQIGQSVLIDDGLIELKVMDKTSEELVCTVLNGGELGERKGVNVPNVSVKLPVITEKDREDILFGIAQGVDFIAASFVRTKEAILEIKQLMKEQDAPYIPIIAKIENAEGIKNIDEILKYADGIMIARGDLGVEIPAHEVPHLQKWLIQKCNDCYKPVITATQMLDSMIRNPRPTRAEVTDVANAVYDGTDAVMLSGETAQGKHPLEALQMMVKIVENTEQHLDYERLLNEAQEYCEKNISGAIGYASVATAKGIDATCIIAPTTTGATARVVSKFKPEVPVVGVTPDEVTLRRMQIYRGVYPILSRPCHTTEAVCDEAIQYAKEEGFIKEGDIVVMTAGIPSTVIKGTNEGMSNMMRIVIAK